MPETSPNFTESLRFTMCGECRAVHAIDRPLYMKAVADRSPVFCPLGHSYIPGDPDKPSLNLVQTNFALTAALSDARAQLAAANRHIAELLPHSPPTKRELLRRARILAARAETRGRIAHPICSFCGAEKLSTDNLARHLRRQHGDDLAEMPASAFESGGQP